MEWNEDGEEHSRLETKLAAPAVVERSKGLDLTLLLSAVENANFSVKYNSVPI